MDYLNAGQCRAARGLLGWSQPDLAKASGVHVQTISAFEGEISTPTKTTLSKLTDALERGGIEFLPHDGVGRQTNPIVTYEGKDGFGAFMDDVYETAKKFENKPYHEICIFNVDERWWLKWMPNNKGKEHGERLAKIKNKPFRKVMIMEGDRVFFSNNNIEYKWVPKELFSDNSFYSYGDKLALFIFDKEKDNVKIMVLQNDEYVKSYNALFNMAWDKAALVIPPK